MIDQSNFLRRAENRNVFNQVKDDTSSLLWLRDSQSEISKKGSFAENLELIDTNFSFDQDLFSSKVYRSAARSSMVHALKVTVTKQWTCNEISVAAEDATEAGFSIMTDEETKNWRRIESGDNDDLLFSAASVGQKSTNEANSIISDIAPSWKTSTSSIKRRMRIPIQRLDSQRLLNLWSGSLTPVKSIKNTISQDTVTTTSYSRVLLVGSSQSGKTTAVKAINFLLGSYDELPRLSYKFPILDEVNEQMKSLLASSGLLDDEQTAILNRANSIKTTWETIETLGILSRKSICGLSDGAH